MGAKKREKRLISFFTEGTDLKCYVQYQSFNHRFGDNRGQVRGFKNGKDGPRVSVTIDIGRFKPSKRRNCIIMP